MGRQEYWQGGSSICEWYCDLGEAMVEFVEDYEFGLEFLSFHSLLAELDHQANDNFHASVVTTQKADSTVLNFLQFLSVCVCWCVCVGGGVP